MCCPGNCLLFEREYRLNGFTAPMLKIYLGGLFLFGIQIACQMTFTSLGKAVNSIIVAVVRNYNWKLAVLPAQFPEEEAWQTA